MRVSLKKAAALAAALATQSVAIATEFRVDIHADAPTPEGITKLTGDAEAAVNKALSIVDAVYAIRQQIGQANEGKINELLTARVSIDKMLAILNAIPNREVGTNLVTLYRQIEAAKARDATERFGGSGVPNIVLETATILNPRIKELKRERLKIEDELANLNFTTMIELPAAVVDILKGFDLV